MLEDYKQSREQMYNLAKKLASIDSESRHRGEVSLVTLAAPECNSTSERQVDFGSLVDCLSRDKVNLHAKIGLICDALNI